MENNVVTKANEVELDKLVNDEDWNIRKEVAVRGREKDLDILVHDKVLMVRKAVARHGRDKDLDLLVRDNDHEVRYEVAKIGREKDLDILVYDEYAIVRKAVARHGRDKDLEILKTDKTKTVINEVNKQLELKQITVEAVIQKIDEPSANFRVYIEPEIKQLNQVEIVKVEETSTEEEYEAFTFEDIDNIIDGAPLQQDEPPQAEVEHAHDVINNIQEIEEKVSIPEIDLEKELYPEGKVPFKTKVRNFFNKIIKKGE